ncbi:Inhibitor of nuclear factor kappa-B kinase-interacting protein, partial [Varanus komodoensis]
MYIRKTQHCKKTLSLMEQLDIHHLIAQMKHLQKEVNTMQIQSNRLIQEEEELQQNLTSLFHSVIKYEESTASVTKDFSIKIATVKTDIRRISGLEADVTLLVENLDILEDKVGKAEKAAIQNIGDLLTSSIDRTMELRSTASENARQIERIKAKSSELNEDLNKQTNKLLDLESDRAKVLTTVAFANDLKPKVHNLKKDFAHLEPMLDELTLRIGRLFQDLFERQKEIAFMNKKLSNLTSVHSEVKAMNDEIT